MTTTLRAALVTTLACLALSGCHVNNTRNGNKENVDIATPFGSMKVNTDKSGDTSAIGITAYPGATPVNDDNDKNGNNADVNLSFGGFHLGVKAATFQSADAQEKVVAFYRKDLTSRYGDVIECQGHSAVGTPAHTAQGLSCSDSEKFNASNDDDETKPGVHVNVKKDEQIELRSGSQQHQHIVSVQPRNGGTKLSLVALDLPSHLTNHNGKDPE